MLILMEKVMKNHTRSHHVRRDGRSKLKVHGFGFLERTLIVLKFSSPSYWK